MEEGFEPTYKELKQTEDNGSPDLCQSFEPTYKELKHVSSDGYNCANYGFEPTYKELKQAQGKVLPRDEELF